MMSYRTLENTMQIENKQCQIYIGCADPEVFEELHESIDKVLKKHYACCKCCAEDDELAQGLKRALEERDKK